MNSLLYLIVVVASNFVNVQTNNSTTVASMNVSETSTSSVLEFNNTVGISKATDSKSNYPHPSASVNGVTSMKIPSSAMASLSDGLKTGISPSNMIKPTSPPVTTRSPSESSVFVQDTASVMNSNISLSTERAPTITATLSVIPSTTIPSYSVAQSTTHAMVTSNVSAATNVTKESVQPNVTHNIQATPSAIASSTSSSDTQYVSSMIPSTAMMVTSDTITTLVNNTTVPILNATTTSNVMMKATQSAVQSMTTPPDTVNSSTSRMMVSSSSPTSVPTASTTIPRNATMPNTTIQSLTSATNASVFSSAVITSFETHIRTTPVGNMTSSIKGLSSSPTISSMTHPSSSQVITPGPPEIVFVRITIDANCSQVLTNQSTAFKAAVQSSVSKVLNISSSKINISAVTCGSIIVDMAIENVNNENITQKLMDAVNNNLLNISYNNETLAVTSVNKLTTKPITPTVATLSVSRDSLTRNPMSSTTIVTETLSGSAQSETTSQVLAISSTSPVKSASDTASVMSTRATNASIFLSATMFSSAVMQTVSPTEKMTTSFETHVRTTPVVNMTNSMKGLSSSPTISSMTHPSSSQVITPGPPEIVFVRITIDANCSQVLTNQSTAFKAAVQSSVSKVLNISSSKINISAVTCGSIIVDMAIENVNNENITQKLMDAVNNNLLNISYNNETLAVTSVNKLTTKPITPTVATLSVSRDSLTRNPMSSTTIVTETLSGSAQSETTSQVLAISSTSPVKSASDTASVMSTRATNASIFLSATMFSSAVMQTVSPTEKMTTSFETHVRTTPVVNMTNSMKGLSSSPTISSMTHPSSSQVITPGPPEIVFVRITIDANCSQVLTNQSTAFKAAVQFSVSEVLNISSSKINISAVICGSIIVDMAIENVNNENITQKLMDAVNNNLLNISYNNETLAVTSVNKLTTKPITPTVTTLSVSRDSLTSNPMSPTTIVTETLSGSPQSETTSQVLAISSTSPVKSASDTASAMSTHAINASIFLNATMFSSAVMQTVSPTEKMTTSFETHVTTSPVEHMTTHATNSSIFAKATMLSSHSSAIMQTMSPTGKMPPVVNMTTSSTGKTNTSFATHVRTSPVVNMTSSMKGLSSSPAISSMAHPSSSQVITPVPPEIVLVRITIDADCNRVPSQSTTFKDAVRLSCSKVLNISASKIKITAVKCGSILVDMEIQNENNENITRKLEDAVNNNQLNISYNGTQLAVTSVKELTTKPTSKNDDDDDDNTALIIYIVFGSVLGLAFLIALVILIARCRRERSTGMFHLPSEENLELSGFSVQNKSYQGQGGNFYGELQPESSEHRLSGIPDESDPAPNDLAGGAEDGGGFGGAYLPAWKNLPTMDMSEVNRNDDTNDNLLLTYGKTGVEEGKDSGKTDVVKSYDNVGAV